MTSPVALRPVLASLGSLLLASCSGFDSDPQRFENLAEKVAAIPLEGAAPAARAATGLRPAKAPPLQVHVLDVHDFYDAREAGLRGVIDAAAPAIAEAAAPVAVEAVRRQAETALRPAIRAAGEPGVFIQLGAFSSEAAARNAWADVREGAARGLSARFEPVQVDGRTLTRLKVGPAPATSAATLCRAAKVADPWCRRHA